MSEISDLGESLKKIIPGLHQLPNVLFSNDISIGDVGDISDGVIFTQKYSSSQLPIPVPKITKNPGEEFTHNFDCNLEGDVGLSGEAKLPEGGLTTDATITFNSSGSYYIYSPYMWTEIVSVGYGAFGEEIWKADPHKYKLLQQCVYQVFKVNSALLIYSQAEGVEVKVNAEYTESEAGNISGSFGVSGMSNSSGVIKYPADDSPFPPILNIPAVIGVSTLRWQAGGNVLDN